MSLDTAQKRASAIGEFSFCEVLPIPDSTIDQADRQTVAWVYGGILAGEADIGIPGPYFVVAAQALVPGSIAADCFIIGAHAAQSHIPGPTAGDSL